MVKIYGFYPSVLHINQRLVSSHFRYVSKSTESKKRITPTFLHVASIEALDFS